MLKGSTRKFLRGLAHDLKPVVQVGKEGLTDSVIAAIDTALTAHELIKVRIAAEREDRAVAAETIAERTASECVGTIGRMAIYFRRQEDPERQKINLPD